ncbi:MAG: hypothetical protein KA714_20035 [Limnoraphis sp. WC205]|jgi:hypothetical protein|nr:hypothetical protein [Limnoraphis sp. WC205]
MLSISFYSIKETSDKSSQVLELNEPEVIEIADDLYEELVKSEFTKIGHNQSIKVKIEDEETDLKLVKLEESVRKKLIDFFINQIVQQSEKFKKIGDSPSKQEIQDVAIPVIERMNMLNEIRALLENKSYQYLDRTD